MGLRERINGLKPGLGIGTAVNNKDFWGISFGRPTAFLLLVLVGDQRWITPNVLTHISNLLMVVGSLLLLEPSTGAWIAAAILLNLSLTFDCADGQLARYRGGGSDLGAYYDKVSDALGLVVLFSCLGWLVASETGELYYFLFAMLAACSQITSGYAKWVAMAAIYRRNADLPAEPDSGPIPAWKYVGQTVLRIFRFAEPDLLFWITIGLALDRLDYVLWLSVITQPPIALIAVAVRARQVATAPPATKTS